MTSSIWGEPFYISCPVSPEVADTAVCTPACDVLPSALSGRSIDALHRTSIYIYIYIYII